IPQSHYPFIQLLDDPIRGSLPPAADPETLDLFDGVFDLRFENELADDGRRGARIADVTLAVVGFPQRELVEAEHAGIDVHEAGDVLAAGVRADRFLGHAVRGSDLIAPTGVVVAHMMDAH